MGIRIHQLSPLIANQIAAGEVIERPASVIKELLENSFDAGADVITVELGYGGLNFIKVSDNGIGIFAEDLPLAVAAHATSKIATLDDLYAIGSMGFRGEALASIASVAKMVISSKPAGQDTAMKLEVQGEQRLLSPCARAQGTTIEVNDLFFNAPVRKRFLKSERMEFQAAETVVKRFALSAPHIAVTLKHNGKQIFFLPATSGKNTPLTRMARIFGNVFVKDAIFLEVESGSMQLHGWISGVNFQRSQNDKQWVYVNQRMVKDKLIQHAIKQVYEEVLYPGRFPACLLYFNIAPQEVDVNVHPTKHEVRFQQPRLVHDFFVSQLGKALQSEAKVKKPYAYTSMPKAPAREIAEPYPQLAAFTAPLLTRAEAPWVILNAHYVLIWIEQQPYVVDVHALQKKAVNELLSRMPLPLQSRPLLVPIRYAPGPHLKNNWPKLQPNLRQLGVDLKEANESEILIGTIPSCTPHLDLRVLLQRIEDTSSIEVNQLLKVLSQAQNCDPRLLSDEEKSELNQWLLQALSEEQSTRWYKALTVDECRNLLNV